ncbi:copper chaperone PCu(A)C [Bauldia sp.]|uniref:copper chaperone PCu(A)C n=1 Tax=Bauldia sp. TaxID=2575872 RepID=UPI003BA95CC2
MRFTMMLAAATLLAALQTAAADMVVSGTLEIHEPWTRATPPAARAGGGFLIIRNTGETADRLVGGTSPAGTVEIHTMEITDGVMKMRELPDGLEIPAGETVQLKPGGHHIMFVDLPGPIEQGAPISVTLMFAKAGEVDVEMTVSPPGAPGPGHHDHGHDGG